MIKALIREFPVTDILDDMTEEKIRRYAYTKDEVDALIAEQLLKQGESMRHRWQNIIVRPQLSP